MSNQFINEGLFTLYEEIASRVSEIQNYRQDGLSKQELLGESKKQMKQYYFEMKDRVKDTIEEATAFMKEQVEDKMVDFEYIKPNPNSLTIYGNQPKNYLWFGIALNKAKSFTLQYSIVINKDGGDINLCLGDGKHKGSTKSEKADADKVLFEKTKESFIQCLRSDHGNNLLKKLEEEGFKFYTNDTTFGIDKEAFIKAISNGVNSHCGLKKRVSKEEILKSVDGFEKSIAKYLAMVLPVMKEIKKQVDDEGQTLREVIGENVSNMHTKLCDLIHEDIQQIILTGPPGTGKTVVARQVSEEVIIPEDNELTVDEIREVLSERIEFVQFHPSYDYTDFIEGLRPVDKDGTMQFKKVDGIFKAFCRKAAKANTDELYFFIIDEVNRADLAKVFGELMFGLEKDKRGKVFKTQYQNLKTWDIEQNKYLEEDVYTNGFYIPENVVIIGTMNDIDRSVESMDFALRRRFTWVEFEVNEASLKNVFKLVDEKGNYKFIGTLTEENSRNEVIEAIIRLNNVISVAGEKYSLTKHHHISQGYFADISMEFKDIQDILGFIWKYRLESLIFEYVRGEYGASKFVENCKQVFIYGRKMSEETAQ